MDCWAVFKVLYVSRFELGLSLEKQGINLINIMSTGDSAAVFYCCLC